MSELNKENQEWINQQSTNDFDIAIDPDGHNYICADIALSKLLEMQTELERYKEKCDRLEADLMGCGWVSVDDRLPELKKELGTTVVIISVDGDSGTEALYSDGKFYWDYDDFECGVAIPSVTDWMPLPEPPK